MKPTSCPTCSSVVPSWIRFFAAISLRWLLRSTPLLAVTAIVFWTVPTFFEGIAMLIVLFFCKIAYEACYTMFNIPMGPLLSAMANTDGERAVLSSARGFGSMVGNMVPMMIFPALLEKYGDSNAIGYGIGAALCAAVGFVTCLLHYFWTEERNISLFGMHMVMDVPAIVHMLVSNTAMGIAMLSIQMQWGLVGETIDYNEMITGKRTEGSIYGTITGLKVICVLVPAFFVIGSWAAFKYVWNITPEVRAEMAERKAAKSAK